ncbi:MAG TPA: FHA domain-containing protein [Steroidobacteraceae bacterium]|nr:FHA domain-containing protein [Steroidobacteraceae bacterium]
MSAKFKLIRVVDAVEFPINGELLVGRLAESGLQITQGLPSRRHALVNLIDQTVWVEDLGSVNGTFVNGTRLSAKSPLKTGDKVRFDVEEFIFRVVVDVVPQDVGAPTMYRSPEPEHKPPTPLRSVEQPDLKLPASQIAVPTPASSAVAQPVTQPIAQSVAQPVAQGDGSGLFKRPGAWADPDSDGANKTKFMDPNALKVMLDTPKLQPAGVVDAPTLVVASGATRGTRIKLQREGDAVAEWTIGSGVECNVSIADAGVSSMHAKLVNDGKRWKLIDQMSANGTYVNGKRSNVSYLSNGDRVGFGPVECEFKLPGGSASTADDGAPGDKRKLMIGVGIGAAVLVLGVIGWLLAR